MNVAERFIRRPVVTILVMLGILLLGVTGYLFLPQLSRETWILQLSWFPPIFPAPALQSWSRRWQRRWSDSS